jgi:hypothetical protein
MTDSDRGLCFGPLAYVAAGEFRARGSVQSVIHSAQHKPALSRSPPSAQRSLKICIYSRFYSSPVHHQQRTHQTKTKSSLKICIYSRFYSSPVHHQQRIRQTKPITTRWSTTGWLVSYGYIPESSRHFIFTQNSIK